MNQEADAAAFKKSFVTAQVISMSLFLSIALYIFMLFFLARSWSVDPVASNQPLKLALLGISLGYFVLIPLIKSLMLKRLLVQQTPQDKTRILMGQMIVCLALAESVSLFGLIYSLLTKTLDTFLIFAGISAIQFVWNMPRRQNWELLIFGTASTAHDAIQPRA